MKIEAAYQILYSCALIVLAVLIAAMLARSVIGPRITDRLLSINMISTMVIASIAILSQMLQEGYLADVSLIYAMISFIAVLILSRIYIPEHPARPRFAPEALAERDKVRGILEKGTKAASSSEKRKKEDGK